MKKIYFSILVLLFSMASIGQLSLPPASKPNSLNYKLSNPGSGNATFFGKTQESDIKRLNGVSLTQMSLPITFDDPTVEYGLFDFAGTISSLVNDPNNPSNRVGRVIKTANSLFFAGTVITDPAFNGLSTKIPFDPCNTTMTVRVWSPDAGIQVLLKAEDKTSSGTKTVETAATTTVAGGWETLTFNFLNHASGTQPINYSTSYDLVVIFFNFGVTGADAGEKIYYFDDVIFTGKNENCTWYFDFDKDGFGNLNKPIFSPTKPRRYVSNPDDCRDWDKNVYPGAPELPDNIDNDCDGEVDEGLPDRRKWYFDKDRDGYGNPNVPFRWSCIPMDEYIDNNLDCRDWDASINPGAAEICNDGKDNNCNGLIDEPCGIVGIDNGKQPEATKPLAMAAVDATGLGVRLWPNPARDVLMVSLNEFVPNQKMELTLMQADGKVQQAQSLTPTIKGQQVRMDVSRMAAGYYILQLKQKAMTLNKQVIIIR